jgi:hypothetical protein
MLLFAALLACASSEPPSTPAEEPQAAPDPRRASVALEEGWGALLFRDEVWMSTGPGSLAAGPKGIDALRPTGSLGGCGAIVEDPQGAMFVLKPGAVEAPIVAAPAIQANLVERAAWRLDELLPALDRFDPLPTSPDPSRSRGVNVGSVAKIRRHGAPPVLIASGHRGCTGVIAILSGDASETLAWDSLADACEPLRVFPPNDLDGDGVREVGAWSRSRATLYRMPETSGSVSLVRLADWTCR